MFCFKCGKTIRDDSVFCQYCGEKVSAPAERPAEEAPAAKIPAAAPAGSGRGSKKQVSKKAKVRAVIALLLVVAIAAVIICETNISKAERLYARGEYMKAFELVEHIPTLGREKLVRMKIGWVYGHYHHSYLTTRRIRLSDTSSRSKGAYQDAFWDLVFGYYLCERDLNNPESRRNDIQRNEIRRFAALYYSDLSSMFHMSKDDADWFAQRFLELTDINEMKAEANEWLDRHFF